MLTVTDSKSGKSYKIVDYIVPCNGMKFLSASGKVLIQGDTGETNCCWPILKPIKWRADEGEYFYHAITYRGKAEVKESQDFSGSYSDGCHSAGNYYSTKAEAQVVADKINKIFDEGV